jgi:hypothetical protein
MGVATVAVPVCVLQPEYEAFKQLLAAPQEEARQIARRRFPVPKIVDCDQNGSQVRLALVLTSVFGPLTQETASWLQPITMCTSSKRA